MGICINYRGQLEKPEYIPAIVAELVDICKSNKWTYHLVDKEDETILAELPLEMLTNPNTTISNTLSAKSDRLQGIHFKPHKRCDSVCFLFDEEGQICVPFRLLLKRFAPSTYKEEPWEFAKTQFAGVETHIILIHLFEYLKDKYFKRFEIQDDGGYYPTKDKTCLEGNMMILSTVIDVFKGMFKQGALQGKSPEDILGVLGIDSKKKKKK